MSLRSDTNQQIAVVALDISKLEQEFSQQYMEMPPEKKLALIKARILKICEELKQKESNSKWVIVWREYGITGANKSNSVVSDEFKKIFKKEMIGITSQFPNLTIIAGSIAHEKEIKKEKLLKVKNYYREHDALILQEERLPPTTSGQQFKHHESRIDELNEERNDSNKYYTLRNTCYIFTGENEIIRHDKITPVNEMQLSSHESSIFQPGKGRNKATDISIPGASKNDKKIDIIVEICREHNFEISKHQHRNDQHKKAQIHFVISDTIPPDPDKSRGVYFIQLDSQFKPHLVVQNRNDVDNNTVRLYQNNLYSESAQLRGPLQPLYPFEKKIMDKFNHIIKRFEDLKFGIIDKEINTYLSEMTRILDNMRQRFIEYSDKNIDSAKMYDYLERVFTHPDIVNILVNAKPKNQSLLERLSSSIYDERGYIEKMKPNMKA